LKKLVWIVVIFLVAAITALVVPIALRYDHIQYEKDMLAHVMSCNDGDLIAKYQGQTTRVIGRNIDRISSTLTVTERKKLLRKPEFDAASAITLQFPDGAFFTVAPSQSDDQTAFVHYQYKGKNRYLSITGYRTMHWISKAISPQGLYQENEVIENP
jgi:hypothetical protein